MQLITESSKMLAWSKTARRKAQTIGFVPTMGYLHEGHLSLIRRAREENQAVVASIFVNPAQFSPQEDLEKYPRDLARDKELLAGEGTDVLFHPEVSDLYPSGYATYVKVEKLSEKLCGMSRPTHFCGVATIVVKLFNLVKPHNAYFGQKDAQQFVIIKRLTEDLNFDLKLNMFPIIRDADGLALSSRNKYLNPEEKQAALVLRKSLLAAEELVSRGIKETTYLLAMVKEVIGEEKLARLDYIEAVDLERLEPVKVVDSQPVLLAIAIYIGNTRLIDNIIFNRENYAN